MTTYTIPGTTMRDLRTRRASVESKRPHTIDALVGNTPLVQFPRLTAHLPRRIRVYGKAEWANPGGSVKDRAALNIIQMAEQRGDLRPGMTLIDSSSGNTGIAYAMICLARGYGIKLVVPANATPERLAILRAYGVDLTLSDPLEGSDGALRMVREIVAQNPDAYYYADQYNNPDNWKAHYKTTGVELWDQTNGALTHFIAGLGTSGTMMGAGRRLKAYNRSIQLLAVLPNSPFHGLEGLKHMQSAIVPGIYAEDLLDGIIEQDTEEAYRMCRRLARNEGVLAGISAGAAMAAALMTAERLAGQGEAATIVAMLPDNASKYLGESFWAEEDAV